MYENANLEEIMSGLSDVISKKIAENIRFERKKAGLTQVELGARIGVSGSMIAQYESSAPYARQPKWGTLEKLAKAMGIPLTRLLDLSSFCTQTFWTDAFREGLQNKLDHIESSDASNIDVTYMRKVAAGESGFSFEDACQICDELGVSPDEILHWDERKRITTDYLTDIVMQNGEMQDG